MTNQKSARFWEILPGASVWLTFAVLLFLSLRAPIVVAFFILFYDLYWVLKIIYLFFHLHSSFLKMRENEKVNWISRLQNDFGSRWERIHHLVILPAYKESGRVIRETINTLANANYAKSHLLIVLATEERGGDEDFHVAEKIREEFEKIFGNFIVTRHPSGVPGEIPGKGSNEAWAIKSALPKLTQLNDIQEEDVLVTVFDVDTQPGLEYFGVLTHAFLSAPEPMRASFQPIPLFINNLYDASMLARLTGLSTSFWQLVQQSRIEQLVTFSSHSMPLQALREIGFWERDIVSEDSRIFFQCLNHYNSNWRTVPLHYPVYMDAVYGQSFWESIKNIYFQQRRWGWGVENISRFIRDVSKNPKFPFLKKLSWFWRLYSGFYSWAASSFIIFIFGWTPLILGGREFQGSVLASNIPKITGGILNFSMIGFVGLAFVGFLLMNPKLKNFRLRHYALYGLQWILTPITTIFLGSLPALDAQTRLMFGGRFRLGFWRTPKE